MPQTVAGISATAVGRSDDAALHFAAALERARELGHRLELPGFLLVCKMLAERNERSDRKKARQLILNGTQPKDRVRIVVNFTYWFWWNRVIANSCPSR